MSKIENIIHQPGVTPPRKPGPQQQKDGAAFKDALTEAMTPKKTPELASSGNTQALGEIQAPSFHKVTEMKSDVVTETATLLDRLDIYANSLADPSKTLREIEPLVTELKERADTLIENADQIAGEDTEVNRIANESAQLAVTEYMRFYRGDYI